MSIRDDLLRVLEDLERVGPWAHGDRAFSLAMRAVHAGIYEDALALARYYVREPVLLPQSPEDPSAFGRMTESLAVMNALLPHVDLMEEHGDNTGAAKDAFAEAFRRARFEVHEAAVAAAREREIIRLRAEHAAAHGAPPRW